MIDSWLPETSVCVFIEGLLFSAASDPVLAAVVAVAVAVVVAVVVAVECSLAAFWRLGLSVSETPTRSLSG